MTRRGRWSLLAIGTIVLAVLAVDGDPDTSTPTTDLASPTDAAVVTDIGPTTASTIPSPAASMRASATFGSTATPGTPTASLAPSALPVPSPDSPPTPSEAPRSVAPSPGTTRAPGTTRPPAVLTGVVSQVVDGDTIRVDLRGGRERVRIIGIDTPEIRHPTEPEACYGVEATDFATDMLDGKTVTLELDPSQDERDRFDRLLAHVFVGNTLYAEAAIAGGYGIHYIYDRPSRYARELESAEVSARKRDVGIWAKCDGRVDLPLVADPAPTPQKLVDTPKPTSDSDSCHPSYDPCVPNVDYDLDCGDLGFAVMINGPDEYRLDGFDHDGRGCESY